MLTAAQQKESLKSRQKNQRHMHSRTQEFHQNNKLKLCYLCRGPDAAQCGHRAHCASLCGHMHLSQLSQRLCSPALNPKVLPKLCPFLLLFSHILKCRASSPWDP